MKSKSTAAIKGQLRTKPVIIMAKDAELGQWYITKKGNMLIQIDTKGPDVCVCTYLSCYGTMGRCDVSPDYPVTLDKHKEEVLMAKHKKAEARCATLRKQRIGNKAAIKTNKDGAAKEKKTRSNKDPRTGFGTGTTAHLIGTIMLDIGVKNKAACIKKLTEELEQLYPGEAAKWAKAWYSNHINKKPEIYKKG